MQDKIFFPVAGVTIKDLHDWSIPEEKYKTTPVAIPSCRRKLQYKPTGKLVDCNEQDVALFRYQAEIFAIKECCPHAGGPLHLGDIEELPDKSLCVRCPWHHWRIDLRSGEVKFPEGDRGSTVVYPVKVDEDGRIFVGFDEFDQKYFHIDNTDKW